MGQVLLEAPPEQKLLAVPTRNHWERWIFIMKAELGEYRVDDKVVIHASAPGIGRWVYEVKHVTKTGGLWGNEIEDTVRELTVAEVI